MTKDEDALWAEMMPGITNPLRPVILPGNGENHPAVNKATAYQSKHLSDSALSTQVLSKNAVSSGWRKMQQQVLRQPSPFSQPNNG